MIRINQIKLKINEDESKLENKIRKLLKLKTDQKFLFQIKKKSLDARKEEAYYVYSVDVEVKHEESIWKGSKNKNVQLVDKTEYKEVPIGEMTLKKRPIIVGFGPAGMFCAYMLAKQGYAPIILERGQRVQERIVSVERFWKEEMLDVQSNVQFGEGGAGTFSDGKLNTMVKDPLGRGQKVLETFVEFGAPEEILYWNKPHIGTDKLVDVVQNMRKEIQKLGGEIHFGTKVEDILCDPEGICGVVLQNGQIMETRVLVLAVGHSARDTFSMLKNKGLHMERKSFAIGLRIQHPQEMIQKALYKEQYKELLPADYKLTYQTSGNRGVYSFCMCPGGYVVNASSEKNMLAINGMSNYDRKGNNANSALVVTVNPTDFDGDDALAGVRFQQKWEQLAYDQGHGKIPIQLLGDFLQGIKSTEFGQVFPEMKGNYEFADLNKVIPDYVSHSIKESMTEFDARLKGFARKDALLAGVETRTSSPVRIIRNELFESSVNGIYPCGEGAGYAGGITSAAMDGIKVYESIRQKFRPDGIA